MDSTILRTEYTSCRFTAMVFTWMFAGLLITSACIYGFNTYSVLMRLIFVDDSFTGLAWLSLLAPFALSFIIRRGINSIAFFGLCILFILYAALIGVCFSFILLDFIDSSVFGIFAAACLVFGIAAIVGYTSKVDFTLAKPILWMIGGALVVLVPLIILLPDLEMDWIASIIGVLLFMSIDAFHFSELKETGATIDLHDPSAKKVALLWALKMYVDFVGLFFFIVAIFFRKKD